MVVTKGKHGGARPNTGGARPGSGRKSRAEEMGLAALLDKCWTLEDREICIKQLSIQAKQGNEKAVSLLLAYTYGKPHETITATITRRDFEVEIGGSSTVSTEEFVN